MAATATHKMSSGGRRGVVRGNPPPGVQPELPDETATAATDGGVSRPLRSGCYLGRLTTRAPAGGPAIVYEGTIRVEHGEAGPLASGDLYLRGPFGAPPSLAPPEVD